MKRFYIAALTGRSGSGKSYAREYLSSRGVDVIDGDDVAREVVRPGERALRELERAFGEGIILASGELDRQTLADICFADEKKKEKLDAVMHPAIIRRLTARFIELREAGRPYCVVEAPALIESGFYTFCDRIVMITAPEEAEIERIRARDGVTAEQARRRLAAQTDPEEVRPLCDLVLENGGTREEFNIKLDGLIETLAEWFIK